MNWEWATAQLASGKTVVRISEKRREVEDVNGAPVRWTGREGITLQHGWNVKHEKTAIIIGTMSRVPIECNADDLAATDWVLE